MYIRIFLLTKVNWKENFFIDASSFPRTSQKYMKLYRILVFTNATLRLNEFHWLVTTVLVLNSQNHEIQKIFLETIAIAASFHPRWTFLIKTKLYKSFQSISCWLIRRYEDDLVFSFIQIRKKCCREQTWNQIYLLE